MQELEPIQTNLHNRINVCIKYLIGSFPYAFAYRPINFFMHTFMRLCKFVWIGTKYRCAYILHIKKHAQRYLSNRQLSIASYRILVLESLSSHALTGSNGAQISERDAAITSFLVNMQKSGHLTDFIVLWICCTGSCPE